jgi:hypothetical protein
MIAITASPEFPLTKLPLEILPSNITTKKVTTSTPAHQIFGATKYGQ